jgi:hypothetical protein
VDLPNKPDEGVSVETDLSHTKVTLTQMRGSPGIYAAVLVGMMALLYGAVGSDSFTIYFFSLTLLATALLNALKTEVELGPRSVTIRRRTFGSERAVEVLPYDAIRSITFESGRFGRPVLVLSRMDGSSVRITRGTKSDLETLQLTLDSRRPIRRLDDADPVPQSLRKLRARDAER